MDYTVLTFPQLVAAIRRDWTKPNYAAAPYLSAMSAMSSEHDRYGLDSGKSVILYFLSNASSWRGDVARKIKAELKRRIK